VRLGRMPQISGSYMPQNSGSQPLKLKYKTPQISGYFIKFSECQAPCANVKRPVEDFLATVLI